MLPICFCQKFDNSNEIEAAKDAFGRFCNPALETARMKEMARNCKKKSVSLMAAPLILCKYYFSDEKKTYSHQLKKKQMSEWKSEQQ